MGFADKVRAMLGSKSGKHEKHAPGTGLAGDAESGQRAAESQTDQASWHAHDSGQDGVHPETPDVHPASTDVRPATDAHPSTDVHAATTDVHPTSTADGPASAADQVGGTGEQDPGQAGTSAGA
jgi:hypothetical protein